MKLTVVVQGYRGSSPVPASEAAAFLVKAVMIDGQEVPADQITLDITPGRLLSFAMVDAAPVHGGWTEHQLALLWERDDNLAGSPLEVEFREAPR